MIPIFRGVVLMLLCCLGRTLANYDPKNYEDLYDFDDYFAHLNPDMLDAAFGYGTACSRSTRFCLCLMHRHSTPVGLHLSIFGYISMHNCRYGASDLDGYGAFSDDDLLYFGNDEENYYNRFGFDPNDYSYELLNKGMPKIDCTEDSSGKVELQGVLASPPSCLQHVLMDARWAALPDLSCAHVDLATVSTKAPLNSSCVGVLPNRNQCCTDDGAAFSQECGTCRRSM